MGKSEVKMNISAKKGKCGKHKTSQPTDVSATAGLSFSKIRYYFKYSLQSVRRMSPLRINVSCMAKAADRQWWVCPLNFSACFR